MATQIARRYVISGDVQGVGFRYFTRETAVREGVTGWVRNLPDGRVEALVEGDRAAVERFEQLIRRGSALAHVTTLEVHDEPSLLHYSSFEVRRS